MKSLLILSVLCAVVEIAYSASASGIANYARSYRGDRTWLYTAAHETGINTNKCNIFVADVLRDQGAPAPNRRWFFYTPIGANEWAKPHSSFLKEADCWALCGANKYQRGDVIAEGGHVGIVTITGQKTTSASAAASPQGLIVENNWGFRPAQSPTCWRYQYYKSGC